MEGQALGGGRLSLQLRGRYSCVACQPPTPRSREGCLSLQGSGKGTVGPPTLQTVVGGWREGFPGTGL